MIAGDYLIFALVLLLGALIGSFLNVVILRFGTGMTIARGRSKCFSCGKTLAWYELIPVLSFLIQRGKCTACGSKISWQYPAVEIAGSLALLAAYLYVPVLSSLHLTLIMFALLAALLCLYIVIFVYDLRHKLIPDAFSYSAAVVALAMIWVQYLSSGVIDWTRVIAGPALFLFFFFFWAVSKGRWMGFGDGKLALSIGWALGLYPGAAAILFSFWIGAIVSLSLMGIQRLRGSADRLGMGSEIPFGPFIIAGFLIALLFPHIVDIFIAHLTV